MITVSISYAAIHSAWQNFIKGKRKSLAIDEFSYNLELNLFTLCKDINSGSYRHGPYKNCIINEKKRRDIAIATVRDKIVHRLLYDYLVKTWDKTLDPDVYSCRKDKGLHKALQRTRQLLTKHRTSFVWRADISKFFNSVDKEKLISLIVRKIGGQTVFTKLSVEVIKSYSSKESVKQGIPIGNLTSQIFSNIYLNEFDRYVRHNLKPQAYIRYGDDFIIFTKYEHEVINLKKSAKKFLLQELNLKVNPKNDIIVQAKQGLKFLGHRITSDIIVVDKNTSKSILRKANTNNIASYRRMPLNKQIKSNLEWQVMQNIFDITT